MSDRIGTCSLCGGPVVMPNMMVNPVAHCLNCGAHAKNPHGPVIPMEKSGVSRTKYPPYDFIKRTGCCCGTTAMCPIHRIVFR